MCDPLSRFINSSEKHNPPFNKKTGFRSSSATFISWGQKSKP